MESNSNTPTSQQARILALLAKPNTRAVLVSMDCHQAELTPIAYGESVLNIPKDLFSHLDDYPHPNEFLEKLRDYCIGRLASRKEAKASGGISIPGEGGRQVANLEDMTPTMFFR